MKHILHLLALAGLLLTLAAGCGGGDKERSINTNKDRPRASDKGE
jgi:hypothetical protein